MIDYWPWPWKNIEFFVCFDSSDSSWIHLSVCLSVCVSVCFFVNSIQLVILWISSSFLLCFSYSALFCLFQRFFLFDLSMMISKFSKQKINIFKITANNDKQQQQAKKVCLFLEMLTFFIWQEFPTSHITQQTKPNSFSHTHITNIYSFGFSSFSSFLSPKVWSILVFFLLNFFHVFIQMNVTFFQEEENKKKPKEKSTNVVVFDP